MYVTSLCIPVTKIGDRGHTRNRASCGIKDPIAILVTKEIARPHPTTPHSRYPSGGPGNLKPAIFYECRSFPLSPKTSTTKGTKVHKGKAVEFKTFEALCVLRGSGFLRAHRQSEPPRAAWGVCFSRESRLRSRGPLPLRATSLVFPAGTTFCIPDNFRRSGGSSPGPFHPSGGGISRGSPSTVNWARQWFSRESGYRRQ